MLNFFYSFSKKAYFFVNMIILAKLSVFNMLLILLILILLLLSFSRIAFGERVSCIIEKFGLLQARRTFLLYKKMTGHNVQSFICCNIYYLFLFNCYTFCQISWLVNIMAKTARNIIRK